MTALQHRVRAAALVLLALALVAGCDSGKHASAAHSSASSPSGPDSEGPGAPSTVYANKVKVGIADAGKTIRVKVPETVIVTLTYTVADGLLWQRASGGSGFSGGEGNGEVIDPVAGAKTGQQVFTFSVTAVGTIPVLLDYAKPGPLGKSTRKQFRFTLDAT